MLSSPKFCHLVKCQNMKLLSDPLPNHLDCTKFKAFANNELNVAKLKICLDKEESIVGKGENAGYHHILLFPQCFQESSLSGSLQVQLCCKVAASRKHCWTG